MMKVFFYTLGCRVNQYETDAVREMFVERGYDLADSAESSDICIVNTCTVTGEADRKSRQQLRKMARLNPDTVVVAMGCAAEMTDGKLDADVVVGTKDKNTVVDRVEAFIRQRQDAALSHVSSHERPEVSRTDIYHDFGSVLSPEGTRAFMKIEDGCNKFCTYCIIPYARGRVASRDEESIYKEARFLASKGFKEIILSGIHICSYGKDRGEDISALMRVIRNVDGIAGIERLRLGSLEPMSLTPAFIEGLAELKHLCPHFHLSLQSGSDTVLARMGRDYDTSEYLERVRMLRERFPAMSLTTDIICGFPGETDDEFEETMDFVERAGFNKIHVFPYSLREGTAAARMKQTDPSTGKGRAQRLIEWSDKAESAFAGSFVGQRTRVLLETLHTDADSKVYFNGYTPEYVRTSVYIPEDCDHALLKGEIVDVDILSSDAKTLIGQLACS